MTDSQFWRFSLDFYATDGIPAACLRLQDECGVDVNVMLYLLFLARSGRLIDSADLARLEATAAQWREDIVQPLRHARRRLKTPPAGYRDEASGKLRDELKRIELEAERLQQLALERETPVAALGSPHPDPEQCARDNLAVYAKRLGGFPQAPVALILRRLHGN